MKKRILKVLVIITMLAIIPVTNFAYGGIDTDITIGGDRDGDGSVKDEIIYSSVAMTKNMLGKVQVIGSIISVAALIIIGIRYMMSSVQEKAQMKGILIYYVIGCLLVFATSNILGVAYDFIRGLE